MFPFQNYFTAAVPQVLGGHTVGKCDSLQGLLNYLPQIFSTVLCCCSPPRLPWCLAVAWDNRRIVGGGKKHSSMATYEPPALLLMEAEHAFLINHDGQ